KRYKMSRNTKVHDTIISHQPNHPHYGVGHHPEVEKVGFEDARGWILPPCVALQMKNELENRGLAPRAPVKPKIEKKNKNKTKNTATVSSHEHMNYD
ncbi:unnamed protein product, partial [Didymodactylos carnosus]